MTKLEKLKAAARDAYDADAYADARAYQADAYSARVAAWAAYEDAYEAELKKTQEENSND